MSPEIKSWYTLPPKQKVAGYVHSDFHEEIVAYLSSYGALTVPDLYWLIYKVPFSGLKRREEDTPQEPRYLYLSKQLQKLTNARAIKRSKGIRGITYGMKSIGQNHHWLDRSRMHMTMEFFCRKYPAFTYDWENERELRKKPGSADAKLFLEKQQAGQGQGVRFCIEIDRGNKDTWEVREQLLAHINIFTEYRDKYQGTPEYKPWRILFATNNRRNMLGRIRKDMASIEESKKRPSFILYTDQARYFPEHPDTLVLDPIWQTAHSDNLVPLFGR